MAGAGTVFFAYIGFDAVSTAAQETKNPQRDMPLGIIGSLIICTVLYIAVAAVATGVVPYAQLDNPAPIALYAADRAGMGGWMSVFIKIGAIAGLSSVIMVLMLGQTRIFWVMSRDGLLPKFVSEVHPKFKTPWIITPLTGAIVAAIFRRSLPCARLADLCSIGTLLVHLSLYAFPFSCCACVNCSTNAPSGTAGDLVCGPSRSTFRHRSDVSIYPDAPDLPRGVVRHWHRVLFYL